MGFRVKYFKNNSIIIVLTLITAVILGVVAVGFSKLNGGKITNNFNERSSFCRDFHNGVLREHTLSDSDGGEEFHLQLCSDPNGGIFVDDLPPVSVLRGGDWFVKCRGDGGSVYYYSNYSSNLKDAETVGEKERIYLCGVDVEGKVLGAHKMGETEEVVVG